MTIVIILVVLWFLGLLTKNTLGGLLHILLVIAVIFLLINVIRNAADASLETGGGVTVSWTRARHLLDVYVDDEGPGLPNTGNLFVPFFTTKPGGSGIGLVLSRQIAEGHGGTLTLENRAGARGCRATLRVPA